MKPNGENPYDYLTRYHPGLCWLRQKIAEWAKFPGSRPTNPEEMRAQCKELAFIPERITDLEMVESTLDKLVIKLPPKEMIEESERIIPGLASYPLPTYYYEKFMGGSSMTNETVLYSRIADYTIGQCM